MTDDSSVRKIDDRAKQFASDLKLEGVEVMEAICLVLYDTPEGPGMVSVSTEMSPQSVRTHMLTKALERK